MTSEGVQLTDTTAMHVAGIAGQGVRVAVIDIGFDELYAAEVPVDDTDPAALMSFRSDGSVNEASAHGTAVAQVVADMAPACTMTLMAVDTSMSIESAIDYSHRRGHPGCQHVAGPRGGSLRRDDTPSRRP